VSGEARPFKLGVREGGTLVPHPHSHAYRLELEESGPPRIVAAPDRDQVGLLIGLSRTLPAPFHLIYVLLGSRGLRPAGRYTTVEPLSREELELFLDRFRGLLEQDGRHHVWIGSAVEPSTLVYDQHQLLLLYGRLDAYQPVLRAAGMGDGPVVLPDAHEHLCHDRFDLAENELLSSRSWTWYPLEPGDEPLEGW
jgi:hypothetical protein